MARIYTKTGDDGTTALISGKRVDKDAPRIKAYGTVDELNAALGVVRSCGPDPVTERIVLRIQDQLFTLGANLALPAGTSRSDWGIPAVTDDDVASLEALIDELEAGLEPLRQFILPGGSRAAAALHLARTVARRAERHCVSLSRAEKLEPPVIRYLNRLSDLFFSLARRENFMSGIKESHPTFGR